ncbi:MAG: hypothetical protein KJN63_07175, partial [Acidimicrobiia bacterium]|nr:hypothetical protein [Acidimicrobiia bacterium]
MPHQSRSASRRTRCIIALASSALLLMTACSSDASDEAAPVTDTAPTTEAAGEPAVEPAATDPQPEPAPNEAMPCDAEPVVLTTESGVDYVRTPDACFEDLPGWSYEP